jgi:hypothetical protein
VRLILKGDPLVAPVLNQQRACAVVRFANMMIGGHWRVDFSGREKTELEVLLQLRSTTLARVVPEVEKKARAVPERTTKVAVLA